MPCPYPPVEEVVDCVGDVAKGRRPGYGVPRDAVAAHGGRGDGGGRVGGADERGVGGDLDEPARADEDGPELEQRVPLAGPLRDRGLDVKEGDLGAPGARERVPLRRRRRGAVGRGRGSGGVGGRRHAVAAAGRWMRMRGVWRGEVADI